MCVVAEVWIILSHKLVCQQRGLTWATLVTPRNFYWLELQVYSFSERTGGGQSAPHKVRGVGESMKQLSRWTLVLGVDAREQGVSWGSIPPLRMPKPPSSRPLPQAGLLTLAPGPPPGGLPDPGIEPTSPLCPALAGTFFTTSMPPGKPLNAK